MLGFLTRIFKTPLYTYVVKEEVRIHGYAYKKNKCKPIYIRYVIKEKIDVNGNVVEKSERSIM